MIKGARQRLPTPSHKARVAVRRPRPAHEVGHRSADLHELAGRRQVRPAPLSARVLPHGGRGDPRTPGNVGLTGDMSPKIGIGQRGAPPPQCAEPGRRASPGAQARRSGLGRIDVPTRSKCASPVACPRQCSAPLTDDGRVPPLGTAARHGATRQFDCTASCVCVNLNSLCQPIVSEGFVIVL